MAATTRLPSRPWPLPLDLPPLPCRGLRDMPDSDLPIDARSRIGSGRPALPDRRRFIAAAGGVAAAAVLPAVPLAAWSAPDAETTSRPRPSKSQLAWQRDELALFLHFGVNTFTDREWGDGKEDPAIFDPRRARRARSGRGPRAPPASGAMILTAKHHDGFCLWPTQTTTTHSVAEQPVARRPRRRGARVRRRLPRRRARRRALSLAVGPQRIPATATRRATTTSTSSSSPSC